MTEAEQPTVYVVDDDEAVRRSLAVLIGLFHFSVECFASAQDFLTVYDGKHVGCLVLDVRLPGLNGLELHSKLLEGGTRLPTIFITGNATPALNEEAEKRGVSAVFQKPFSPQALIEAIRTALTSTPA
jgi:FixJ family two-component response regulator